MEYLLLAAGLALVIFGGDLFVRSAVQIAEHLRLPNVVIGGTLVSLATTSPEVVVSVTSAMAGKPGLALGNAVGSVMCNIALIAGLMAVIRPFAVRRPELVVPLSVLGGLSLLTAGLAWSHSLTLSAAVAVLGAGLLYFFGDLVRNLRLRSPVLEARAGEIAREHELPFPTLAYVIFVVGAGLVVFGSRLLVDNAIEIARALSISEAVIGYSVVAVGTSLPELVTAITSARKNVADLSVGNIIGANIANLTLVMGAAGIPAGIPVAAQDVSLNMPALLIIVGLLTVLLLGWAKMTRWSGWALMGIYSAYITLLIVGAAPVAS